MMMLPTSMFAAIAYAHASSEMTRWQTAADAAADAGLYDTARAHADRAAEWMRQARKIRLAYLAS